jgi:hypothetical protein
VEVTAGAASASVDTEDSAQSAVMSAALEAKDVLAASPGPELLVRVTHPGGESLAVCRTAPKLACSKPILIGESDWKGKPRFDKTETLVIEKLSGVPPSGALGVHPLVFAP